MTPIRELAESRLDDAERGAIAASHLGSLPAAATAELTREASRLRVPAGGQLHRAGESSAHCELVVAGLARAYVTAADGRTMTVRYCRPGALIGVVSLFRPGFSLPAAIDAVTAVRLLVLRPSAVRFAAARDPRVASALLEELSERVVSFIAEIPGSAFSTVRQRVARHLLDLAVERRGGGELVVAIHQQELADAVGTVREVVVRALRELRRDGLMLTRRDGIVLLDPERLAAEAHAGLGGGWNESP
jgi:CRP/FNR family transcriptional regulator, cyclic AMP receptor protein